MRCINCGIAIQRLKRHLISSLSAHHQTRLSRWLTNAQTQLPLDTLICQPCFLLLNTEAGEHERLLGHNMVCLGCGKSLRKLRHHNVSMDSPLLAVLISQNSINVQSRNNYICHVCWMRTNRQAGQDLSPKLQELGPYNIQESASDNVQGLASDNNAAIPNVQVVSPPEPPPLPPVFNRLLQKESTSILLLNYKRALISSVHCICISTMQKQNVIFSPSVPQKNIIARA